MIPALHRDSPPPPQNQKGGVALFVLTTPCARFATRELHLLPTAHCPLKGARQMRMVVGVGRLLVLRRRILLERLHGHLHRLLELRIVASRTSFGSSSTSMSGAMPWFSTSHSPFGPVDGPARRGDGAAVHQLRDSRRCPPARPRCACRPAGRSRPCGSTTAWRRRPSPRIR